MKVLLDTHYLIWVVENSKKIPPAVKEILQNPENEFYYSMASVWEITIKYLSHRQLMSHDGVEFAKRWEQIGLNRLNISLNHIASLKKLRLKEETLPHQDPFDRLLIAQALSEDMILLTSDKLLSGYDEYCVKVM